MKSLLFQHANRISVGIALLLGLTAVFDPAAAQRVRTAPGAGGDNYEMQAAKAAQDIKHISETIMTDYVSKAIPLMPQDIQEIENNLKKLSPYKGRLDKPSKAYLHLIEAYIAHYSGKGDEALSLVRKAMQQDDTIPDVSDSAIALALCYGDFVLAKSTLKQRKSGEDVTLEPLSSLDQSGSAITQTPGGMGGAGSPAVTGQPSKWSIGSSPGQPGGMGGAPGMGTSPSGMGYPPSAAGGSPSSRRTASGSMPSGVLGLPVECMPYDELGETISSMNLKNMNGSYFYYESGKGQLLCIFLWTLPYQDNSNPGMDTSGSYTPPRPTRSYASSRSGYNYSTGASTTESKVPNVAFDLEGNLEQYRQLMLANSMHGRMMFVTMNLDAVNQYNWYRVMSTYTKEPWPWANCMAYDPINAPQWVIEHRYSPVMIFVDSQSQIRYIGPVGGFLPQMLINMELPKAKSVQTIAPPTPPRMQSQGGSGGLLDWLAGKGTGGAKDETGTASTSEQTPATTTPTTPKKEEKVSDPQAKSMLTVVYVKKRISPRSALLQCDEILERFGNTIEADEAKLVIESILKSNPEWIKERKEQGKYTGE